MASRKPEQELEIDDQTRSAIAKRFRQELKRVPIKQSEVAVVCGVSRGAVNNWVKGRNLFKFSNLYALGLKYSISVDYILFARGGDHQANALASRITAMPQEARKQLADMFAAPADAAHVEEYGNRSKR